MINAALASIDKTLLESLVENGVREDRTLEFKEALPGPKNDDKKEFLADVTAFANAAGGDIVYGVTERREGEKNTGIAGEIQGLGEVNIDAEIRRLENMLRDSVEPRIAGIQFQAVTGFEGGPILVLRIQKSYLAPHMVKTGDSRFYTRNNGGKHALDVTEIRSAFALSESLPEKIRRFRDERVGRIVAEEMPVDLRQLPKTILHILPLSAIDLTRRAELSLLPNMEVRLDPINPQGMSSRRARFNLDGYIVHGDAWPKNDPAGYCQVFRSGAIEAVDTTLLLGRDFDNTQNERLIEIVPVESFLIGALRSYLEILKRLAIEPPYVLMLSFAGVKGYRMDLSERFMMPRSQYGIDRNVLFLPEAFVENLELPTDKILQPVLDSLWQSVGYERDFLYQDDGSGRWKS